MESSIEKLPHVTISGGLLSHESMVRLMEIPDKTDTMKLSSYIDGKSARQLEGEIHELWEWAKERWDEFSNDFDEWDLTRQRSYWSLEFLRRLGFNPVYQRKNERLGKSADASLSFHISHRGWRDKDKSAPRLHVIKSTNDFDHRVDSNRATGSPHESLQKLLVLNEKVRWGILFNGKTIRLLREYYHIYTRGYVEFDLENIISDRRYDEFKMMYQVLHASRFRADESEKTPLDNFFEKSAAAGVKIGQLLRGNVHKAIEVLGNALLGDRLSAEWKDCPEKVEEFYAQILRIIYRIVFILYAEQRGMLPGADSFYGTEYSLTRLRREAESPIYADSEVDLWIGLQKTFKIVREGIPSLNVTGFDGDLFDPQFTRVIDELSCKNEDLLLAIRLLTTTEQKGVRQRISFLDLDVEEMGAVYESLLDYKPRIVQKAINVNGCFYREGQFALLPQSVERKSTGSYYTHKSLVSLLVQSALAPVLENRLKVIEGRYKSKGKKRQQAKMDALLNLNVCDPACGSGAFLLAAMDFLGLELARINTGFVNPSEQKIRIARREVLQRCIYGVDKNPLAVELTKMSLWLHAFVRDLPLNFLNHHIKVGDSLVGATESSIESGIPPKAFVALRGQKSTGIPSEDMKAQRLIRKHLKLQEASGSQTVLIEHEMRSERPRIADQLARLESLPETSIDEVSSKARSYLVIASNPAHFKEVLVYNIWTSAFFWPLDKGSERLFPTNGALRTAVFGDVDRELERRVSDLASRLRFFHWRLEFPDVFAGAVGGFDCILTNPPWETLQMKENEFFAGLALSIEKAATQAQRRKEILRLGTTDSVLHDKYVTEWKSLKRFDSFLRESGLYGLSARGTINTYALFVERFWSLLSRDGLLGMIVPSAVATSYYMQDMFREMVKREALVSLFDFENKKALFDIHRMFRFCLLTLSGRQFTRKSIPMAFYCHDPEEIQEDLMAASLLSSSSESVGPSGSTGRVVRLASEDFELMNPNTLTCPLLRSSRDYEITHRIYKRVPILIKRDSVSGEVRNNSWRISFQRNFDMSGDSRHFHDVRETDGTPLDDRVEGSQWMVDGEKYVPLYEGKMIWFYDHRYNSVQETSGQQGTGRATTESEHKDSHYAPMPRHWVSAGEFESRVPEWYQREWFIGFRDITNAMNQRTMVCSFVPRYAAGHEMPLVLSPEDSRRLCSLVANLSSIPLDYIAKQKVPGTHMSFFILEQLPVFSPRTYGDTLLNYIVPRVVELMYTSYDMKPFAKDCGFERRPFKWNAARREILKAELDAMYAHLYDFSLDDYRYILSKFKVDSSLYLDKYLELKPQLEELM